MADIDLPVFSFRPNRREAMSERLSFLTDVLRASQGAEQRRSVRETPRRSFDADFLLTGPERTFWDLFMNRLGGENVMVPIYWEVVSLSSGLTAGVSDRIDFDTDYTEWPYFVDGLALVAGDSALDWEVVEIAAVDSGGIDLVAPITNAWPIGSKLYPLRRAVVEEFGDLTQPSAAVGRVTARLRFVAANPWTPATEPAPIYGGLPVLLSEPNWVDDLSAQFEREIATLDTNVGLTYQVDVLSRFFVGQAHRYFLPGREQMAAFRDLLYRYRGRAGSFWLPTFKADFKLAASVSSGSNKLAVENVGFQYTGGPTAGREYIVIRHEGGVIFRKIVDVIPGATSATEKLVLDNPVGLALSPGQVRKISFMDAARFDADEFEIAHHAGPDGLHECSTAFRTFKNTRTVPPGFTGLSWLLPCGAPDASGGCACESSVSNSYISGGDPTVVYDVALRVRGVIEFKAYSGGTAYGGGGRAVKNATGSSPPYFNTYKLVVSDPPAEYFLNNGSFVEGVKAVNYNITVPIRGNAVITLTALANDGAELRNASNVVAIDDDPSNPIVVSQPYNGQFLQIDGSIA